MSERRVRCPGDAEAAGQGQLAGLGLGQAGLRRRKIKNPGSVLSFS
jgi:hypothetical protein